MPVVQTSHFFIFEGHSEREREQNSIPDLDIIKTFGF